MKLQLFKILCVRFKCDYTLVTAVCVVQKFVNRVAVVCAEVNIGFVFTERQERESLVFIGCNSVKQREFSCFVKFKNVVKNFY